MCSCGVCLLVTGMVMVTLAFAALLASLVTSYWMYASAAEARVGLWQACVEDSCEELDDPGADVYATGALVVAAAALVLIVLIILASQLLSRGQKKPKFNGTLITVVTMMLVVATILLSVAAMVYGLSVYSGDVKKVYDLYISYYLIIAAAPFLSIAGCFIGQGAKASNDNRVGSNDSLERIPNEYNTTWNRHAPPQRPGNNKLTPPYNHQQPQPLPPFRQKQQYYDDGYSAGAYNMDYSGFGRVRGGPSDHAPPVHRPQDYGGRPSNWQRF